MARLNCEHSSVPLSCPHEWQCFYCWQVNNVAPHPETPVVIILNKTIRQGLAWAASYSAVVKENSFGVNQNFIIYVGNISLLLTCSSEVRLSTLVLQLKRTYCNTHCLHGVEHWWNGNWQEKAKILKGNPGSGYFPVHKFHMDYCDWTWLSMVGSRWQQP